MPDPSPVRPKVRALLFDLYGDFAMEGARGGAIRLSAVARLAEDLGATEVAARAAMGRMAQDGWLAATRAGRESVYALTPRGRELVEQGRRRIFASPDEPWDGSWCVVALSVPEAHRELRDRMRKQLSWLGFGSPSSALHVSPRDHAEEVLRFVRELDAGGHVQVYRAAVRWPHDPLELVVRAWGDLSAVNQRYASFLNHFTRPFERARSAVEAGTYSDREAFRTRLILAGELRRCLFDDPDLPAELLPAAWWGSPARRLFLAYHALVTPQALRYFDAASGAAQPAAIR